MASASEDSFLSYKLYQSAGGPDWGGLDALFGEPQTVSVTSGLPSALIVFGEIPAGQVVSAGRYADTVVIEINVL